MANSKSNGPRKRYATVDTAPGADGYGTDAISPNTESLDKLFFSFRGTGSITVTLQFKCDGDTSWQDYADYSDFTDEPRKLIEGGAGKVKWRLIVKSGAYSSGSLTFGFDW